MVIGIRGTAASGREEQAAGIDNGTKWGDNMILRAVQISMTAQHWRVEPAAIALLFACLLFAIPDSRARELTVQPGVDVSEYYTDNIFLTPDGSHDYVTEITPTVAVTATGSHNEVNARYRMQNLSYARNSDSNKTYHQLSADLASEIINDRLYLDGNAAFSQRQSSVNGILDPNRIAPSANLTNVITYDVKPRYHQRIDAKTSANISYDIGQTRYRADAFSSNNTTNQALTAEMVKRDQADRLNWNLRYQRRVSDKISNTNTVFEKTEAQATYDVTAKTSFIAVAGYEKNHYQTLSAGNNIEDSLWSLGINWALSKRTSTRLTFGHRFYGTTRSLRLKHSTRLTSIAVDYAEDLTTSSLLQQEIRVFDDNGNPIISLTDPSIASQVYLNKKLGARFAAHTGKISLNADASHTKRLGQSFPGGENIYSGSGSLTWQIAPRTRIEGSGHALYRQIDFNPQTIKQADASLGVSRNFRDKITAGVYVSYLKRVTAASPLDYTRKLIRAQVSVVF